MYRIFQIGSNAFFRNHTKICFSLVLTSKMFKYSDNCCYKKNISKLGETAGFPFFASELFFHLVKSWSQTKQHQLTDRLIPVIFSKV